VLDDVSFTLEEGKTVAVVGSSGCGKSTLVNLLLRYYDPQFGKVLVLFFFLKEDECREIYILVYEYSDFIKGDMTRQILI
jgi:ABC-type multidrug transport system fused ATPase/permease subunit